MRRRLFGRIPGLRPLGCHRGKRPRALLTISRGAQRSAAQDCGRLADLRVSVSTLEMSRWGCHSGLLPKPPVTRALAQAPLRKPCAAPCPGPATLISVTSRAAAAPSLAVSRVLLVTSVFFFQITLRIMLS